jgi:putative serine protease PepD
MVEPGPTDQTGAGDDATVPDPADVATTELPGAGFAPRGTLSGAPIVPPPPLDPRTPMPPLGSLAGGAGTPPPPGAASVLTAGAPAPTASPFATGDLPADPGSAPAPAPIVSRPLPASAPPTAPADPNGWWNRPGPGGTGDLPAGPPLYDLGRGAPGYGAAGGVPTVVPPLPAASDAVPVGSVRGVTTRTVVLVALLSAVIAAAVTGGLFVAFGREGSPTATRPNGTPVGTLAPGTSLDIHALLDRATPSVVSIRTGETTTSGVYDGAGSGVIISAEGDVLTNAHVVNGASEIKVTLADGSTVPAELVGSFPDDDIALVRAQAEGKELIPAELGSSEEVQVGDPVVAIGNALNLGGPPSVTEGIISAKNRDIQTRNSTLRNLIQTDAAINPGNSGGPLLDAAGRVVGINTAIISEAQNIGFAIAIDEVKPLIEDLRNGKGTVTPDTAYLGVATSSIDDVSSSVLDEYEVNRSDGAFVNEVVTGSAAEEGGLKPGDVIVDIDGESIAGPNDVGAVIRSHQPGDTLTITVERQGSTEEITVTLKSRADTGN